MPAANPTTKISSTRAKASETSLPSNELALMMALRMVVRRLGLFDGSPAGRLLESSDTAGVALEFIGFPPMVIRTADSSEGGLIGNPYVLSGLTSEWRMDERRTRVAVDPE
jgi:hypothetical protein